MNKNSNTASTGVNDYRGSVNKEGCVSLLVFTDCNKMSRRKINDKEIDQL